MGILPERINFKMDLKKLIKKALVSSCVIFTVITAIYMLILQMINISAQQTAIQAERVLLFFVFSVLLAIANALLSVKALHTAVRHVVHYIIYIFGFWTCFCLPNSMTASQTLVGIVIFTLGYIAFMLIYTFFKKRIEKTKQPEEKYKKTVFRQK